MKDLQLAPCIPAVLVARILRDLLAGMSFETVSDLKDALRRRCIALRMTCDANTLDRALDLVGSNRALVEVKAKSPSTRPVAASPSSPPPTKETAAKILHGFGVTVCGDRFTRAPASAAEQSAPAGFPALRRANRW